MDPKTFAQAPRPTNRKRHRLGLASHLPDNLGRGAGEVSTDGIRLECAS